MKKMIFVSLLLCGCLPQQKITGRVIDQSGPVPGAALLGMVWVEDAANAKPAPITKDLDPEGRDAVLEQDMTARGLPVAYSRAFSDKDGWFTLDELHFNGETRKAVAVMKEPRITRVTVWAFQHGYRKQAVTTFLKDSAQEIASATMLLSKPADWKELYRDNTVDSLTRDYMVKGYSKEFGATEAEKDWILEYTHSNLWKAYIESDIRGDKEMAEMCGRDYSDLVVSSEGIYPNPERERCAELKQRMGAVRDIEELWISHANKSGDHLSAAKELVKRAIALLPAEIAEPKEYESMILAGLEDAANAQVKVGLRNGLSNQSWQDTAIAKYASGDKSAAYRALGDNLYWQISKDVAPGELTAQVSLNTIPGIKDKAAGFYLLMNRPLTAQLPNGDGGNHKDKPGYKVAESSGTENPKKMDYRIERQEERGMSRVKILSPEGKVLRNFAFNDVAIAKSGRYLLHSSTYAAHEDKGYAERVNDFYTIKGEKKWSKTFRSYPASWDPEVLDPSMGQEGLSDNGDRSYYNWRNEEGKYCIAVYDENGKELARTCMDTGLYDIEISPDGKLVGANTYLRIEDNSVKHLLFLDADTGRTKLVKAEGDRRVRYVLTTGGPLVQGKILIQFGGPNSRYKRIYVKFDDLPLDAFELLQKDGAQR